MRISFAALRASLITVAALFAVAAGPAAAKEVNIYTTREPGLIQPLLDAFTRETNIKVNTVFLKDGLKERVQAEGQRSPADILMTVDIGNLVDLVDGGVTQPINSKILKEAIPANLRDANGHWYALSLRDRVLYQEKNMGLTSFHYEDLADPKWRGRVCIRSGQHPYNVALIAAMIAHNGEAATEKWLRGVKANLARSATGGDRDVARDIMGGICDLGLANAYYVGRMRSSAPDTDAYKWGQAISVIRPTFAKGGTHVNVSGAAVAKHAPHKDSAIKLLEYLVSDEAQSLYARANYEYPVKAGVALDPIVESFGPLNVDTLPLTEIAAHRQRASELVDEVGFDN